MPILIAICFNVQLISLGGVLLSLKGNGGGGDPQEKRSSRGTEKSEGREKNKKFFFKKEKIGLFWILF